jgi:integrase
LAKVRKRTWQTKTGEHAAWVCDYFSPSGPGGQRQRHSKTFPTRKEATAWLANAVVEIKQGIHTPAHKSPTVIEAGEAWIEQAEADGLERASIHQYRTHLDLHIKLFLGLHKLAELTPAAVQSFRNVLMRQGRSRSLAGKVVSSLGSILAEEMARGQVARNVVHEQAGGDRRRARVEKRHTRKLQVGVDLPTKDELRAMIEHAGRLRPLLLTAIFSGLTSSELRGLTWDDVDFDRRVLTVRQRADRWDVLGPPKSDAGKREVPLAPVVVAALREWKLACPRLAADGAKRLRFVFPDSDGNVDSHHNIHRSTGLGRVQFAAGITADPRAPKYGLHSLRHTAASLFIEQGFSPKRVQALMGHSSIGMTFDCYGHLWPSAEDDQVAMAQVQARLIG